MSFQLRGLGNDIVEIHRIRDAMENHGDRFIHRIFTPREQVYCSKFTDAIPHYAARFSAKEAVVKALGMGFGEKISWLDIEIVNNAEGKPEVYFSDKVITEWGRAPHLLVAISHSNHYVSTVAIWGESSA